MAGKVAAKKLKSRKLYGAIKAYLTMHEVTLKALCEEIGENYLSWKQRIERGVCRKSDVMEIARWINPRVRLVEVMLDKEINDFKVKKETELETDEVFYVLVDKTIIN